MLVFAQTAMAADCGRIPELGPSISVDYYFIGVAPIGGFFVSGTGVRFGVIADDGKFWFNDEFEVSNKEASCLLPYFEDLLQNANTKPPRNTLNTIIKNLRSYMSVHNKWLLPPAKNAGSDSRSAPLLASRKA